MDGAEIGALHADGGGAADSKSNDHRQNDDTRSRHGSTHLGMAPCICARRGSGKRVRRSVHGRGRCGAPRSPRVNGSTNHCRSTVGATDLSGFTRTVGLAIAPLTR